MSNSLDPDHIQHFVRLDHGLNSLQRFSTDDTSSQTLKVGVVFGKVSVACFKSSADYLESIDIS